MDRRGVSLVMALAATLLVESLSLVALRATGVRIRLAGDARWRIEGVLVVSGALGVARVAHRAELVMLEDGASVVFPVVVRADGWTWRARADRSGVLIRLSAVAERRAADGTIYAARRASLLLARDPADTVRVSAHRARF